MLGRAGRVAKGGGSGEHDDVNVRQTNRHAAPALRRQDADPLLCTNRQSCSSLQKWVTDTPSLEWKVGTQEGGQNLGLKFQCGVPERQHLVYCARIQSRDVRSTVK